MPGIIERFFGSHDSKNPQENSGPKQTETPRKDVYDIQNGHAYVLLGGSAEEIQDSCGGCGAPYKGPCQSSCEYCSTTRKVHYTDITDASFPAFSKEDVTDLSFVLPGGDSAEFGYNTYADMVVAEKVTAQDDFSANLVIAKEFIAGLDAEVDTLIIVDGGSAELSSDSTIGTLITGKDVGLIEFGYHCTVDLLLKTSGLKYKAKDDFSVGKVQIISQANFIKAISEALRKN